MIGHMLFLAKIHDQSFQPCAKLTVHLQTNRRVCAQRFSTTGTGDFELPHFNDLGLRLGYLRDLRHIDNGSWDVRQVCLTVRALGGSSFHDFIRMFSEWTGMFGMSFWGSPFFPCFLGVFGELTFLIA